MNIKSVKKKIIGQTEKCVGEFKVHMPTLLPCKSCKIKIYKRGRKIYYGFSDIEIIMKYDGCPEGAVGYGNSVNEALSNTINQLINHVKTEYPEGLSVDRIEYTDASDF